MKVWTQEMLPLQIVKDLGVVYATPTSKSKSRLIEFKCPECSDTFRATPSKVLSGTTTKCGKCGHRSKSPKIDNESSTKQCTTCKEHKPLEYFYKNSRRYDNLSTKCKSCSDAYKASWVQDNFTKEDLRNLKYLDRYSITLEEYKALLEKQNYSCAICGSSPDTLLTKNLCVDHCHTTNKVRRLLCHKCNTGIGLLGDTKEDLLKAFNYLAET